MSSASVKPKPESVSDVESVIDFVLSNLPLIKSLAVVHDVDGGEVYGAVDDTDHELELASGVSYLVIGLGRLPTGFDKGINFVELE